MAITPLQTGTCTHPRETHGYQPTQALRHLIEIRQAVCARPGCRRAATACDLDHTIPYHLGGRTCECDLGPPANDSDTHYPLDYRRRPT
jgi:hypothetical protein